MKFFYFTQISSSPSLYLASLDDVPDIPELSHQLFAQYSKHNIQQPRSDAPNISSSDSEIHFVVPTRKMSNFLAEDYEAVLKFMSVETQKKKLKLRN